jgi:hypothetical protein
MGRPLQEAVQGQQDQIQSMGQTINQQARVINQQREVIQSLHRQAAKDRLVTDYIAHLAGVTQQVTAIRKKADAENPAQPVPNPASQSATESTEEAVTPETYDNAMAPGQTPGSTQNLPADTTGTAMDPGATLPTAPYNDLTDVTAPVQGTETQRPLPETRTEVDVRVGDPMNLERAFEWQPNMGPDAMGQAGGQQRQSSQRGQDGQQKAASREGQGEQQQDPQQAGESRSMASMRLARLRIQAGVESNTDDLSVAASIQSDDSLSDDAIDNEIQTLSKVMKAASSRQGQGRPRNAVPRSGGRGVQRTMPSMAGGEPSMQATASVGDDTADSDLFD